MASSGVSLPARAASAGPRITKQDYKEEFNAVRGKVHGPGISFETGGTTPGHSTRGRVATGPAPPLRREDATDDATHATDAAVDDAMAVGRALAEKVKLSRASRRPASSSKGRPTNTKPTATKRPPKPSPRRSMPEQVSPDVSDDDVDDDSKGAKVDDLVAMYDGLTKHREKRRQDNEAGDSDRERTPRGSRSSGSFATGGVVATQTVAAPASTPSPNVLEISISDDQADGLMADLTLANRQLAQQAGFAQGLFQGAASQAHALRPVHEALANAASSAASASQSEVEVQAQRTFHELSTRCQQEATVANGKVFTLQVDLDNLRYHELAAIHARDEAQEAIAEAGQRVDRRALDEVRALSGKRRGAPESGAVGAPRRAVRRA